MKSIKFPIMIAVGGAFMLSACTDPARLGGEPTNPNRQAGALIGAGSGAMLGAIVGGSGNRASSALVGAVVGGALGAGAGFALDQQEAELREQLVSDGVTITNTGDRLVVTLSQDLLFDSSSYAIQPILQRDLKTVAINLQKYPESNVQVIGHTDSSGAADYNQTLSERRAAAVTDVLVRGGVAPERVQSIGVGESQPVVSNLTPEGRAKNRRVEIIILPNA